MMISLKTWPPGGGVCFPYMEYIEKTFRFHLLLNLLTDFSNIWHKVSLVYSVSSFYKILPSGVRPSARPSVQFSIHFFSETACLILTKLCHKCQCTGGTNYYKQILGIVIPLVAMATGHQILKNLLL